MSFVTFKTILKIQKGFFEAYENLCSHDWSFLQWNCTTVDHQPNFEMMVLNKPISVAENPTFEFFLVLRPLSIGKTEEASLILGKIFCLNNGRLYHHIFRYTKQTIVLFATSTFFYDAHRQRKCNIWSIELCVTWDLKFNSYTKKTTWMIGLQTDIALKQLFAFFCL